MAAVMGALGCRQALLLEPACKAFLRDYQGTVLMTCHDRDVMNRVVKKIVEIDGGHSPFLTRLDSPDHTPPSAPGGLTRIPRPILD